LGGMVVATVVDAELDVNPDVTMCVLAYEVVNVGVIDDNLV